MTGAAMPCTVERPSSRRMSVALSIVSEPALLQLSKCLGFYLVQELEIGDLLVDELLAVSLDLKLHRLFDARHVLVVAEGGVLRELLPHEAGDLRHQPDGQAALLVEIDEEILAIRPGRLEASG